METAAVGGVSRGKPEADAVEGRALDAEPVVWADADCETSSSSRCSEARICESTASRHARAGADCGMRR